MADVGGAGPKPPPRLPTQEQNTRTTDQPGHRCDGHDPAPESFAVRDASLRGDDPEVPRSLSLSGDPDRLDVLTTLGDRGRDTAPAAAA